MALKHDYMGLFREEIAQRKDTKYPPFWRAINLRLEDKTEEKVELSSKRIRNICDTILKRNPSLTKKIEVLGPTPAFLSRIREKYRWHMLIKGKDVKTLHTFVREVKDKYLKSKTRVKLIVCSRSCKPLIGLFNIHKNLISAHPEIVVDINVVFKSERRNFLQDQGNQEFARRRA